MKEITRKEINEMNQRIMRLEILLSSKPKKRKQTKDIRSLILKNK